MNRRECAAADGPTGRMPDVASTRVVFLYIHPHACHRGFAEAIGARFWYYHAHFNYRWLPSIAKGFLNGLVLPRADVLLCEGGAPLAPALVHKLVFRGGKMVELVADETFDMIRNTPPQMKRTFPWYVNLIHRVESRFVDGAIAVSEYVREGASGYVRGPIRVAFPYIGDERYEALSGLRPDIESHNIVSIGHGRPMKGMDILVEAFEAVKAEVPDSRLCIVGAGYPERWSAIPGVTLARHAEDIGPYLGNAGLYVQPSRGDAFPVAVLEALCAGVPAVVSESTGSKEVVCNLGAEFVRRTDAGDIAKGMLRYFALPSAERRALSDLSRQLAGPFRRQSMCDQFAGQFQALLRDIGVGH
jgi:glycosyltransferase involved in cell wall biosynthesis